MVCHWRYGDSEWTPSPRGSSIRSSTGGSSEEVGTNPYARLRSAWDSGKPVCMRSEISALVSTNHCLSSCYLYDREQCFRQFGSENLDWQSIAFTLWSVVPLGSRAGTLGVLTNGHPGKPRHVSKQTATGTCAIFLICSHGVLSCSRVSLLARFPGCPCVRAR